MHAVVLNTPAGTALNDPARNRALGAGPGAEGQRRHAHRRADQPGLRREDCSELAAILKSQHRVVYARPQTTDSTREDRSVRRTKPGVDCATAGRLADRRHSNHMRLVLCLVLAAGVALTAPTFAKATVDRPASAEATADRQERRRRRRHRTSRKTSRRCFAPSVEVVSLNVTVSRQPGPLRHRPRPAATSRCSKTAPSRSSPSSTSTNLPIALSLLIDSSASMEQRMENAQDAAIGFAQPDPRAGPRAGGGLRQPRRDQARRSPTRSTSSSPRFAPPRPADRRRCTTPSTSR